MVLRSFKLLLPFGKSIDWKLSTGRRTLFLLPLATCPDIRALLHNNAFASYPGWLTCFAFERLVSGRACGSSRLVQARHCQVTIQSLWHPSHARLSPSGTRASWISLSPSVRVPARGWPPRWTELTAVCRATPSLCLGRLTEPLKTFSARLHLAAKVFWRHWRDWRS